PTVADRVAQMVVKMTLEPEWDHKFHSSSFGYRPKRSAHQAVQAAKVNCWKYAWVIDLDIKGFFDNLNHDQLQQFVAQATDNPWCKLYIKRWITAGWFTYYGAFYPSALQGIREAIECRLTKWVKGKYPRKRSRRLKAYSWLTQIKQWRPTLFAHW